jgi:hypothetical protein
MQIVIDIPEEIYQHYKKIWQKRRGSVPESCIAFGTPLQKGHGRLIDADDLLNDLYRLCDDAGTLAENPYRDNPHIDSIVDVVENSRTIIPADNDESE